MRVSMVLSALGAAAFAGPATANPTPIDTDVSFDDTDNGHNITAELIAEGHEIYPMTFSGDFGPDGEFLSFNGTIQEVMEQIRLVNPSYDFDALTADTIIEPRGKGDWRKRDLRKRDCKTGDWARGFYISDGINYLRKVPKDTCNLRSKGCTRVSCSWKAAIFVCWEPFGDSPKTYEKSWDYVADYAEGLTAGEWCPRLDLPQDPYTIYLVKGKAWDPKGMARAWTQRGDVKAEKCVLNLTGLVATVEDINDAYEDNGVFNSARLGEARNIHVVMQKVSWLEGESHPEEVPGDVDGCECFPVSPLTLVLEVVCITVET